MLLVLPFGLDHQQQDVERNVTKHKMRTTSKFVGLKSELGSLLYLKMILQATGDMVANSVH